MHADKRHALARRIYDAAHLTGQFRLRSGAVSNEYFDKYLFEANPALLNDITLAMAALIPAGVDMLAGLEMGGIPIATMLAHHTGIPALFVRKAAKTYGTCKIAEGGDVEGRLLLIIEDVVTSGGQILASAAELRREGALVERVLCVIDREAGGAANLAAAQLSLSPLFTMTELRSAATD